MSTATVNDMPGKRITELQIGDRILIPHPLCGTDSPPVNATVSRTARRQAKPGWWSIRVRYDGPDTDEYLYFQTGDKPIELAAPKPKARKPRTYLPLAAMPYEAYLHLLQNSAVWEETDAVTAPMGYWAYKHTGCGEIVHVPSNAHSGADEMVRAGMDICMTELLSDPDATDADRRALIHHLSGIVQLRGVSQWATHQALDYIRTLSEEPEIEPDCDDHDGSLPSFRTW
ncbi:hypothetical protein AB0B45_02815 [Nonomuraea sp. NPDC049152]|uniref:hypothetical protein n=1 Tax=Nonomuraea sp. NPDC049152 TaxID=3154350 RepID=UPI0033DA2D3D